MGKQWVIVRLEKVVHDDLVGLRDSLVQAYSRGQTDLDCAADGISLSTMIGRLIRHLRNDRRRMREARARNVAKRAASRVV